MFIDRNGSNSPRVFVNFTSQLSALRVLPLTRRLCSVVSQTNRYQAVNALNGRIFNGNAIVAMFYDREKFDLGIYDHV